MYTNHNSCFNLAVHFEVDCAPGTFSLLLYFQGWGFFPYHVIENSFIDFVDLFC